MRVKTLFEMPYAGVDKVDGYDVLINKNGDYSIIIRIVNPVVRYSASASAYEECHHLLINALKLLGDDYLFQKQDIISRDRYLPKNSTEFLQRKYDEHFAGRERLVIETFVTVTRQVKKGALYTFDLKALRDFIQVVGKIEALLPSARLLDEAQINLYLLRLLSMEFRGEALAVDNLSPSATEITSGRHSLRSISLIDIDSIDLPVDLSSHIELNDRDTMRGFPVDFLSFLFNIPGAEAVVFNQLIELPNQVTFLRKLEQKKKRHTGIPDPANQLCVDDIDRLLADVARENQLLVNCHFNIAIVAATGKLQEPANYVESALFQLGVIPSRNAYNQLELFRSLMPGNGGELKPYDWFLTTCDAAACFFFKESLPVDEVSDFSIRFTDRQGIPVAIDPSDLPMRTGRINARNRFCLGPSGSGKSFFMNALLEQYMLYNMDVVIVDTGHSYSGICAYYKGKYITYSEQAPITMNPFQIDAAEYNIEKKDFLCTLIGVVWKGAEGELNAVERDVIANVLSAFYSERFAAGGELSFNAFYDFAIGKIPEIKAVEHVVFDFDEFRYVLKKFYRGGEFQTILNQEADQSLFTERFVVFEIDSIKEHKILAPITTLIIMDVFIQKMRHRKDRRKALIVEEAWKAIANPLMAGYLLYLYKTVRKFWGEAIVVTQELGDIISNPVVKDSIINNSDTIFLLDQSKFKDNYQQIATLLSISETERRKIFTINQLNNREGRGRFKEVYIRRGSVGEVYGVEVSLEQYLAYTTEKPEKSAVESYTCRYGSYEEGLSQFVADYKASGLTLPAFFAHVNRHADSP